MTNNRLALGRLTFVLENTELLWRKKFNYRLNHSINHIRRIFSHFINLPQDILMGASEATINSSKMMTANKRTKLFSWLAKI